MYSIILLYIYLYSAIVYTAVPPPSSNWAGTVEFNHATILEPESIDEIVDILKTTKKSIRIVGTGHSANEQCNTNDTLISLHKLHHIISIDGTNLHVEGGITFADIIKQCPYLDFTTMTSVPEITLVGSIVTASHGSNIDIPILPVIVTELTIVRADGTIDIVSDKLQLKYETISLGLFGIIVSLRIELVPTYNMRQCVYPNVPFYYIFKPNLKNIFNIKYLYSIINIDPFEKFFKSFGTNSSISLFTVYYNNTFSSIIIKTLIDNCNLLKYNDNSINHTDKIIPIDLDGETNTVTPYTYERASLRLPHFLPYSLHNIPSNTRDQVQLEYFIPMYFATSVISELQEQPWFSTFQTIIVVSEIRAIAADTFPLSPCNKYNFPFSIRSFFSKPSCLTLQFTITKRSFHDNIAQALIQSLETFLQKYHAKPHWGKYFQYNSYQIYNMYPRYTFRILKSLQSQYDPNYRFQNTFLKNLLSFPSSLWEPFEEL